MKLLNYLFGEDNEEARKARDYLDKQGVPYEFSTETGIVTEGCGIPESRLPVLIAGDSITFFTGVEGIIININQIKKLSTLVFDSEGVSIMPVR